MFSSIPVSFYFSFIFHTPTEIFSRVQIQRLNGNQKFKKFRSDWMDLRNEPVSSTTRVNQLIGMEGKETEIGRI